MKTVKGIKLEKHEFENLHETTINEGLAERILSKNQGYIEWDNGQEITREELIADFLLYYYPDGSFSITMKNEDFYINDIEL